MNIDNEQEQDFGWALTQLRAGFRVSREGWNGKGAWLELQYPDEFSGRMTLPFIFMFTAQGDLVPWLASQTDVLAFDWELAASQGFAYAVGVDTSAEEV